MDDLLPGRRTGEAERDWVRRKRYVAGGSGRILPGEATVIPPGKERRMPFIHPDAMKTSERLPGELEVTVAGETQKAGPGCVAVVPADALHSVRALTSGEAIVANHPVRHEFL
jgi:hypothetical protein